MGAPLESGRLRAWIVAGALNWDRLAHDQEARPLEKLEKAIGDDLCCDLGRLMSCQARPACEAEREAGFHVAASGGRWDQGRDDRIGYV
jgi:hypothetical protein